MRPLRIATAADSDLLRHAHEFFESPRAAELFDTLRAALPLATEEECRSWMRAIAKIVATYERDTGLSFDALFEAGHAGLLACIARHRDDEGAVDAPRSRLARFGMWWARQGVLKAIMEARPPLPAPHPHTPLAEALFGLPGDVLDERAKSALLRLAAAGEEWAMDVIIRAAGPAIAARVERLAPPGADLRALVDTVTRRLRYAASELHFEPRLHWYLGHLVADEISRTLADAMGESWTAWTPAEVERLASLNNRLHDVETQLLAAAARVQEECCRRLAAGDLFLQDYEAELSVSYYAPPDFGDPVYCFELLFTARPGESKAINLLGDGTDWKPWPTYPDLGRPYCYLLHDLLDHSPLHRARLLTIEEVWAEVVVREQRFIRLVGDGRGMKSLEWVVEE